MITAIILGYIMAIMFLLYGKNKVTEPNFKWIKIFFYIASLVNFFCSTLLIYKFFI